MRRYGLTLLILSLGACGDIGTGGTQFTVTADSTGDTIQLRISGGSTREDGVELVEELRVGALDGAEELTFGSVSDVLGTADGGLLVHDGQSNIARFYDATGAFVKPLGGKGGGPGEYGQVNGITRAPSGEFFVWDASGGRINRYSADGEYLGMFRSAFTGWFTQNALFADRDGRLAMWTPIMEDPNEPFLERRDSYVRLTADGEIVDTLLHPIWPDESEPLQAQSRDGRSRSMTTRPWTANGVTTHHPHGGLVSGPGGDYVFYILPDSGRPTRVVRDYTAVPVSETERSERQAQIEQNFRRLDPGWNWTGAAIPSTKPAYQRFLVGEDGRIWVQVFAAGVPIPQDELEATRPRATATSGVNAPARIQLTTREPLIYDVYEPDGRPLWRVALPKGVRILRSRGSLAWGTLRDDVGVDYAVRFRIQPVP